MNKKNIALILSGGEGKRFDKKKPKQFFKIYNKSILEITVRKFIDSKLFKNIVIVCPKNYKKETSKILKEYKVKIVIGSDTRQKSVLNGIKECIHCQQLAHLKNSLFQVKILEHPFQLF